MLPLEDDQCCFVCGPNNPEGLRLRWEVEGNVTTAQFVANQKYQGWKGIVHGGIIATVLDEAMTRLVCAVHGHAVTAEITVRFVAPAPIGEPLAIRGEIVGVRGKIVEAKASVHSAGTLIAHATGKVIVKPHSFKN